MKKLSVVLGLVLSISSVSNAAFCLKQYSRNMNRYTASSTTEAKRTNFAAAVGQSVVQAATQQKAAPVRRIK
jgi:hypothetical protein